MTARAASSASSGATSRGRWSSVQSRPRPSIRACACAKAAESPGGNTPVSRSAASNPGVPRGIYIGNALTLELTAFVPDPEPDPDNSGTSGAEGVAVDANGDMYGAEVGPRTVRKYVRR